MDTRKPRSARDFIRLARQKTADSHKEIFGNITDLFLDDSVRLSDRERSLMIGILRSLITEVETELRVELSGRISERRDVPDALKSELAHRSAEIARPILMQSQALRSPDLVEAIKFRCGEHRLAITMRPSLATDTGDAGPEHGDEDVIEILLHHSDPDLVQRASDYLVAEAERVDRMKMPVLRSADLSEDLARRVHWWVSAAMRTHIVSSFSVNQTVVDTLIETATQDVLERRASAGQAIAVLARRLIDTLAEWEPVTADLVVRMVQAGRIPVFLAGLARFAQISEVTARRVALRADGESLAILCKATGVDRDGFLALHEAVAGAAAGTEQLPSVARNSILAFYDTITKGNARAALNFWRRDPEFVSAIEQVGLAAKDPPASE